jgi:DNA-binding transcriptional ArsR family regulator
METLDIHKLRLKAEKATTYMKLLSHPSRLVVLCRLSEGEACVSHLESQVDLSQSALSQHLARMRAEGIVDTRRQGQQIYYYISDDNVMKMLKALHNIFCDGL